ncbi:hypothetical protein Agabi119p4_3375 [Agaricus bisporus var. burnettii]|uniref:SAP domain-containing protein n=1 Tax=Agaricus bisporus var. burnettii TaxID=192524 RepID=A0A8H7F6Y9_AGABI|nr:hypothetical protein Agabi119p4_3372 [Agaricus bisporus var. burnettii]KAF7779030.1 hypothetical protein Agabi119p4_3375 [Agaricus bisporus var. burnettii]
MGSPFTHVHNGDCESVPGSNPLSAHLDLCAQYHLQKWPLDLPAVPSSFFKFETEFELELKSASTTTTTVVYTTSAPTSTARLASFTAVSDSNSTLRLGSLTLQVLLLSNVLGAFELVLFNLILIYLTYRIFSRTSMVQSPDWDASGDDLEKGTPPTSHIDRCDQESAPPIKIKAESIYLPEKLLDDGEYSTMQVYILSKTRSELIELCRGFNLSIGGTKPALLDRLRHFASQPEQWKALLTNGARRPHRGLRKEANGTRKASTKVSAQRRENMFGYEASPHASAAQPPLPTARSKDNRSIEQKQNFLEWARRNVERNSSQVPHPFPPREVPVINATTLLSPLPPPLPSTAATAMPSLTLAPSSQPACLPASQPPFLAFAGHASVSPAVVPTVVVPNEKDKERAVQLGGNFVLRFRPSEIPYSAAAILSQDIPRIAKIWDDTLPCWDPAAAALTIHGHPVALRYWPQIYFRDPRQRWESLKRTWNAWKTIALYWHEIGAEGFWSEFTDESGKRWSYTRILDAIRKRRKEENLVIMDSAVKEFGPCFSSEFSYRKGKEKRVALTEPSAIARYYKRQKV